jgi:methylmalonyl-CoA mutase cobalamin-binding subunit
MNVTLEQAVEKVINTLDTAGKDTITGKNGIRIPVSDLAKYLRIALAEHQPYDFYNPDISADLNRKIQSKGF